MKKRKPTSSRPLVIMVVLAFTCFYYACGTGPTPPGQGQRGEADDTRSPSQTPTAQQPEITVTDFLKNEFDPLEDPERAAIVRAWNKVPHRENYVIGHRVYGEIAGAYGLASVVVDKTVATSKKFSLVVFIKRPGNRYDLYWIYRNEDLSRFKLSRASGDVFVSGAREDGSSVNCQIEWSRKDNKWTCSSV